MGKDYGEPIRHDPNFNGPIHNRSCTDVVFLILFIAFLGVWGYVGYYSMQHGSIEKLLAPIDSNGRRCGIDSGLENKKNLLFFNIAKCVAPDSVLMGCRTPQVCVEKCPDETKMLKAELDRGVPFEQLKSKIVCTDDINVQNLTPAEYNLHVQADKCTEFVFKSQSVLYRCIGDLATMQCRDTSKPISTTPRQISHDFCVRNPKQTEETLLSSVGSVAAGWMKLFTRDEREAHVVSSQIVQDLVQSKWYLLGALVAVVIVCFIYILLLRWVIAPVVWASICGLLALLAFAIYLCYKNYVYYRAHPISLQQTTNLKGYAQTIFSKQETWMVLLIALAVILLILLLVVIFLRSRITIAIALIQEGSKAVTAIKSTVFFPLFPWALQCLVIGYGVIVLMYLLSMGSPTFNVIDLEQDNCDCGDVYKKDYVVCDPATFATQCRNNITLSQPCEKAICHFTGFDSPHSVIYLHLANLLGFFWAMFFVSGVTDMILASTFSTWYWTFHKRDLPFFTLTSGIYRTTRYHLGTVAFGALIIAIVRVIRVILEYIDHKVKKFDNPLTRCIMCCCKCFFWCLESFLKFINKNAYIMCAVHGKNFCKSASDAFSLLIRNIIRVVVLDKVADFIFFLSKLLISIGIGFAVYYILQWNYLYEITHEKRLHNNYVPAIILGIATYLICTIFFNVYSMAVDTLFLCFLEDCERNDGSPEKPYFMSKNLMKILGKKNKKINKTD
ncbi:choline transporter-like 2 isoform X2 [Epargyreus clarus]|uniref:choline transporter-like 2 isoform X2 n=1 Tax=Epargyreus clarus TaxID=520877 RepID=UPI003C2BE130